MGGPTGAGHTHPHRRTQPVLGPLAGSLGWPDWLCPELVELRLIL